MYYSPWPIVTDCNNTAQGLDFRVQTCHTIHMKNETALTVTKETVAALRGFLAEIKEIVTEGPAALVWLFKGDDKEV